MPLSLFQPNINFTLLENSYHLNAVPSSFPSPIAPDAYSCDPWYATPEPPLPHDCQLALNLLPSGTTPEPFSAHFHPDDPNHLPLEVSHGTCEIIVQLSGEAAELIDQYEINPTDIRNMAGWVIDQCVSHKREGGAITRDLKHATDWVLDPSQNFYDANMPPSTTYLSLYIWNFSESQDIWNAGDEDPGIGYDIAKYVADTVRAMPEGDDKVDLKERVDDLWGWVTSMDTGKHQNWWEPSRN